MKANIHCLKCGYEGEVTASRTVDFCPNCGNRLDGKAPEPIPEPIPMILTCPLCGERHIDKGVFATKPHHTHACQKCGLPWRPALVPTVGVQFLPGFKNEEEKTP